MTSRDTESVVSSTKAYYDGPADQIYRTIWGDNLHLGVPCGDDCPHPEAMEHTNEIMAKAVDLKPETKVLDLDAVMGLLLVSWLRTTAATSPRPISARKNWN